MDDAFTDHFRYRHNTVAVTADVIDEAMDLIRRHGLRGYDAVQLATARSLQKLREEAVLSSIIFVTADSNLLAAAQAEGLTADNPNLHS